MHAQRLTILNALRTSLVNPLLSLGLLRGLADSSVGLLWYDDYFGFESGLRVGENFS